MKRAFFAWLFLFIVLFLSLFGTGCSTTKSIYKKIRHTNPLLKKRVLVVPPLDQAGLGEKNLKELTDNFNTLLRKDKSLLISEAPESMSKTGGSRFLRFGILFDPDIAKKAGEMGMNVLITAVIHPYEVHSQKKGIWPFRKVKHELEISMAVNALDLTTGTLFLTHLESEKLKIPETSEGLEVLRIEEQIKAESSNPISKIDEKEIQKTLSKMLARHASVISNGLIDKRWSGKIISVDGQNIVISAGRDVGLTAETVFEVFDIGETIQSPDGRSYHLLGSKIGEIETRQVMEKQAAAIPLVGMGFKAGQIIKIKE